MTIANSKLLLVGALLLAARAQPATAKREIIVSAYVAPVLQFEVLGGRVAIGDIITCEQEESSKKFDDHTDDFLTLTCEKGGLRLQLDRVYFNLLSKKTAFKVESVHDTN